MRKEQSARSRTTGRRRDTDVQAGHSLRYQLIEIITPSIPSNRVPSGKTSALGIDFVSLNESIDTSTPIGKMVFTILGAVGELEALPYRGTRLG